MSSLSQRLLGSSTAKPMIKKPNISINNFNRIETIKKVLKVASIILFAIAIGTLSVFGIGHLFHIAQIASISSEMLLGYSAASIALSSILFFSQRVISKFQKKETPTLRETSHPILPSDISNDQITPTTLTRTLDAYSREFPPIDSGQYIGKIEKIDMDRGSKLIIKADLHGDLKSLVKYLKNLQRLGFLDANYRVKDRYKNKIVIAFLGDYVDRGDRSFKTLNLLMKLKMLNPNEIVLLKGNHENIEISRDMYIHPRERHFYDSRELCQKLDSFFSTLSLSALIGTKDEADNYQYTCLTHGAIDPDVDMQKVLSNPERRAEMLVKKGKKAHLSKRIKSLLPPHLRDKKLSEIRNVIAALEAYIREQSRANLRNVQRALLVDAIDKKRAKLILSALKVQGFLMKSRIRSTLGLGLIPMHTYIEEGRQTDVTSFNWGDISDRSSGPNRHRGAGLELSVDFIKDYFRAVSTGSRKVKALRAGHLHQHRKFSFNGKKGFIEILPVAGELEHYDSLRRPIDFAQIVTLAPRVKDWIKQTVKRNRGKDLAQISREKPFYRPRVVAPAHT